MPTIEDVSDTELEESSTPRGYVPHLGGKGHILEMIGDDNDSDDEIRDTSSQLSSRPAGNVSNIPSSSVGQSDAEYPRPSASTSGFPGMPGMNPNTPMGGFMGDMMKLQELDDARMEKVRRQLGTGPQLTDRTAFKGWNTVYPLYFDAKVSAADGRRVARKDAVWWPVAMQIGQACRALGLPCVLEADRCHPADWKNAGRVKVIFEDEGKFLRKDVKNRTSLYKVLAAEIRRANPSIAYHPPQKREKVATESKTPQSKTKSKATKSKTDKPVKAQKLAWRPPVPQHPVPDIEERLPLHSRAIGAGIAVAAMKRDLEAEKENKKKGIGLGEEGAGKDKPPKMKKVVVRARR